MIKKRLFITSICCNVLTRKYLSNTSGSSREVNHYEENFMRFLGNEIKASKDSKGSIAMFSSSEFRHIHCPFLEYGI